MIKVFLVEDEVVVRNIIKKEIHWEEEGVEVVGEASDGERAVSLIRKTKPDILITDIRMPYMDGLELSRTILKEMPEIKILIISGYGEFKYVQEAMSIGVLEYLLKPVSYTKFLETIRRMVSLVKKEQEEKELWKQYSLEQEENRQRKIRNFFDRLVTEQVPMAEALEEGRRLGLELAAEKYIIILFKLRMEGHEKEYSEQVEGADREIRTYAASRDNVHVYERGAEGLGFLFMEHKKEELEHNVREFCRHLVELTRKYEGVEFYAAVGKSVNRLRELQYSFYEANKAFSGRFSQKWNRFVLSHEFEKNTAEIDIENFYSVENIRKSVQQILYNGTLEEVESFIDGYFGNMQRENMESAIMRQYICTDIYFSVIVFGEKVGIEKEELMETCGKVDKLIENIGTMELTMDYIKNILQGAIRLRDSVAGGKYSDIMVKARHYIQEHYMEDDVSLNRLASYVNMSPSYFSTMFSQAFGKTFVEYLTEIRMEKAKELLLCSDLKISEIVYQVGYKNSHYFNYIFRKTQNCSPREYRNRGKTVTAKDKE